MPFKVTVKKLSQRGESNVPHTQKSGGSPRNWGLPHHPVDFDTRAPIQEMKYGASLVCRRENQGADAPAHAFPINQQKNPDSIGVLHYYYKIISSKSSPQKTLQFHYWEEYEAYFLFPDEIFYFSIRIIREKI